MKHVLLTLVASALLVACGGGGDVQEPLAEVDRQRTLSASMQVAPTLDVVVMLKSGIDAATVAASVGAEVVDQFGQRPIFRLRLSTTSSASAALAKLGSDPRVSFAELNAANEVPANRDHVVWVIGSTAVSYANQWVPTALGLTQAHAMGQGAGVRVAVLDTGVDLQHPALSHRFARRADGSVLGIDLVAGDMLPAEEGMRGVDRGFGHGTHVAGLLALVAPQAQLMPVRVLDPQGRGNVWVLAEALMWALDPDGNPATDDGARIVNLSLGTTIPTRLLNTAIELATCSNDDDNEADDDYSDPGFDADRARCDQRKGAVVMAAAGNSGSSTETLYPAAEGAEGQLAVTASTRAQSLAKFSNHGPWVQLAAPGDRVVSTVPGGGYGTWSGTSMASPVAAGVAALVLSLNPDWKPVDVTKRLMDRSVKLCGTELRGVHALGAVADFVPGDPFCP